MQQQRQQLHRQNTNMSSVRNEMASSTADQNVSTAPRRTSVYTNNTNTSNGGGTTSRQQQQGPVPKPRNKPEAKIINLQKLNTAATAAGESNFQNSNNDTSNNNNKTSARVIVINNTGTNETAAALQRPKTGGNIRPKTSHVSNSHAAATASNSNDRQNNNQNNGVMIKLTGRNTVTDMSTSKVNLDPAAQAISNAAAVHSFAQMPELSIAQTLAQINAVTAANTQNGESNENGLNEYTLQRILKWLEDMEKCTNMIKPPTQLMWSETNADGDQPKRSRAAAASANAAGPNFQLLFSGNLQSGGGRQQFGADLAHEFALSDYDSFDEQVVEYNRVVDKTFHIVHDED
jgi:hypothetical protein